jgi:hypothetical protein
LQARLVTHLGIGANPRLADRQIVDDGGGHYWNSSDTGFITDSSLLEESHYTAGRIEAKHRTPRQDYSVHSVDQISRLQQIGLASPWSRATHIDPRDRAVSSA